MVQVNIDLRILRAKIIQSLQSVWFGMNKEGLEQLLLHSFLTDAKGPELAGILSRIMGKNYHLRGVSCSRDYIVYLFDTHHMNTIFKNLERAKDEGSSLLQHETKNLTPARLIATVGYILGLEAFSYLPINYPVDDHVFNNQLNVTLRGLYGKSGFCFVITEFSKV